VENRIDADPEISAELSLWGQGTSNVIRGNMIVIPIENNILYVEPIYITGSDDGGLPEIKRIIIAYGDKIVSKPTFDEAIAALFGVSRPVVSIDNQTLDSVIQNVLAAYEEVKAASKANEWENYGKAMQALDDSIRDLRDVQVMAEEEGIDLDGE
jgi:uncharacterized membrane protein (UPF0182 family)